MCNKNTLNSVLNQLTEYSKHVFGDSLKSVVLYGLYARGDYDDESDIDVMLMIDMPPEELRKKRKQITHFCADINVENGIFISPKLQSIELFDKWKDVLPFYKNVETEGIRIYG